MFRVLKILLFFLIIFLFPLNTNPQNFLIKGGKIIIVTSSLIDDGEILVENGKIKKVGKKVSAGEGIKVIDAEGKFITPGLVDPHSHIGLEPWPKGESETDEATDPLTPQMRVIDAIHTDDIAMKRALLGGVTTVQVLPGSSNIIGGIGAIIKLKGGNLENMLVQEVNPPLKMAFGENPKRIYGKEGKAPQTRMGSIAILRKAFYKAKEYLNKKNRKEKNDFSIEPKWEVLSMVLEGKLTPQVHCYRVDDIYTLVRISEEFGFNIAAIHHATEAYKVPDVLKKKGIGVVLFSDLWGYKMEAWEANLQAPKILTEKNVKVAFHTDHPVNEQRYLIFEAAKAMRYGLAEEEAWKTVTINPATIMGVSQRIGSLEEGKDADIVIWDGDPMEIGTRVEKVFIDGVEISLPEDK